MNKPNKTELEYFIRYSLDSDKYKRYIELYDEIERLNNVIKEANEKIHNIWFNVSSKEHNFYLKLDETYQGKELLSLLELKGVDKE